MNDQPKERVWTLSDEETDHPNCLGCDEALQVGREVVECPRCKTLHHLSCWIRRGGCAQLGCPQTADTSLTQTVTPSYDPPTRETLAWLPVAVTIVLLLLAVGGGIWAFFNQPSSKGHLSIMVTTGPDVDDLEHLAADFSSAHEGLDVSVLVLPADSIEMYEQKLIIMLAAKDPPDIVMLPHSRFVAYAAQGALAPLDAIKDAVAESVPYGKRLGNGETDGHLYGVPHPSRLGILAIPASSQNLVEATGLLLHIVQGLPFTAGLDDLAGPPLAAAPAPMRGPTPASKDK